jgi:hypothetical protein
MLCQRRIGFFLERPNVLIGLTLENLKVGKRLFPFFYCQHFEKKVSIKNNF